MVQRLVVIDDADGSITGVKVGAVAGLPALCRQHAAYTLTSTTAVQQLFNSSANGRLTLPVGTYRFHALYQLTGMSTALGNNSAFSLAGSATLANVMMYTVGVDSSSAAQNQSGGMTTSAAFSGSQQGTTTSSVQSCLVEGSFEVTVAGTIIPSVALVAAAAAVVTAGSFLEVWAVGATTLTTIGAWD